MFDKLKTTVHLIIFIFVKKCFMMRNFHFHEKMFETKLCQLKLTSIVKPRLNIRMGS